MSKRSVVIRMSLLVTALCAAVAFGAVVARAQGGAPSPAPLSAPGRYVLFAGQYRITASSTDQGVFKLDTETGQAWVFATGVTSDGVFVQRWSPISN